jgi:uncharacterized DUF497 family protein
MIRIEEVLWLDDVREKIQTKHGVTEKEVERVLQHRPHIRLWEKGHVKGQDLYTAYGRSEVGRYLIVFFIRKPGYVALPISARDMTRRERQYYGRQKKTR